jgi:hypothetical protein
MRDRLARQRLEPVIALLGNGSNAQMATLLHARTTDPPTTQKLEPAIAPPDNGPIARSVS